MAQRPTLLQGTDDDRSWLVASRVVGGELSTHVRSMYGYIERSPTELRRRELPAPQCVLIIEIGEPIRIYSSGQKQHWHRYRGGFVSGLDEAFTLTAYRGEQSGVQLNLTPIGARLILGIPMHELANRVVALPDVLPDANTLAAQLFDDPSWEARFDRIEGVLLRRLSAVDPRTRAVAWAFDELLRTRGQAPIESLCRKLGYSHKHVITLFRDHIGVTPKKLARLVRFDAVAATLRTRSSVAWGDLAAELGYTDQAHLAREVSRYSGLTPTALRRLLVESRGQDVEE